MMADWMAEWCVGSQGGAPDGAWPMITGCEGTGGANMLLHPGHVHWWQVARSPGRGRPQVLGVQVEVDVPLKHLSRVSRVSRVVWLWCSPRRCVPELSIFIKSLIPEDPTILIPESEDILYNNTSEQYYHFCH